MDERKRGADLRAQIDENLRRVYRETIEEDIPGDLAALLDRLRAQDADRDAVRDEGDADAPPRARDGAGGA